MITLFLVLFYSFSFAQGFKGEYFNQKTPGLEPEKFAPGIISTNNHEACSGFYNQGRSFIFQRVINDTAYIFQTHCKKGKWTEPNRFDLLNKYKVGDFCVSPDGLSIFFVSNQQVKEFPGGSGGNIYVTKLVGKKWSTPKLLDKDINTKYHDSYPCVAKNGNLYFFSRRPGGFGKSDLYLSKLKNGVYQKSENMGAIFNTTEHEWDSYIADDESYIVFCSMKKGTRGEDDLFVSFKKKNGKWSKPVSLGDKINTKRSENRPYITPDNKYLIYTSNHTGNREIYWVSIDFILNLKPKD